MDRKEGGMSEETTQTWLVERSYGQTEDLVTLVYATKDGKRHVKQQLSHQMLFDKEITAGRTVQVDRLERVADEATHERYHEEAVRMVENHDPDEAV
ncbi:hypothetical protein ACFQJ7_10445 [Halovenus rubra]|uniref:DUF7967 domain-containing protein n=2 Tax=Halovenus rubra TaxID=869890 RepID=A0ABD5X9B0_9EURY|nr:hypothetical protein [Halovenus rubra]